MPFLRWILLGLVASCIGRNIVNKRGRGTLLPTVLGVVVVIAGEWLLGPGRPPKTQRAGASIRLDERHDDAVSTHQRKPPSSEVA
jgi:uncharacterized membrane protein YeaQ/YmgE (transglycosylase-associated protein family)